jgi:hypothetical protein
MFTYYNNACIRKLVIGFGSLFNNIHIKQLNKNGSERDVLVPLTYAPKEKFYKRLTLPSSISDQTRIELNTPQIAFELTNMVYDPLRKMNKLHKKTISNNSSFMEVPYNFTFGLYAYTRNIEENLQIIEQILPYFSPEFVITLNLTNIHQKIDVPIVLAQSALTQEYEGDFSTRRTVTSTFVFTAKSYVYNSVAGITGISDWNFITDISGVTVGMTGPTS